jgi:hypothetical protein
MPESFSGAWRKRVSGGNGRAKNSARKMSFAERALRPGFEPRRGRWQLLRVQNGADQAEGATLS